MVYIIAELPALAWLLSKCVRSLAALSSCRQPMERQVGRSWTGPLLPSPGHPLLSVSPKVFGTEETRRQGQSPRGLQSKQMLALGLLENFQINYFSVENSFLTK